MIVWQNELVAYRDEKGKPYSADYLRTIKGRYCILHIRRLWILWGVAFDMPYILWCEIEGMSGIIKTLILLGYFLIGGGLENGERKCP